MRRVDQLRYQCDKFRLHLLRHMPDPDDALSDRREDVEPSAYLPVGNRLAECIYFHCVQCRDPGVLWFIMHLHDWQCHDSGQLRARLHNFHDWRRTVIQPYAQIRAKFGRMPWRNLLPLGPGRRFLELPRRVNRVSNEHFLFSDGDITDAIGV